MEKGYCPPIKHVKRTLGQKGSQMVAKPAAPVKDQASSRQANAGVAGEYNDYPTK